MSEVDQVTINMYDLLICLTNAGDLISPEVSDHHQQVAYLSFKLAEQLELPVEQRKNLMLAGLLHDVGAFSLNERLALIEDEPLSSQDHASKGARLIEGFAPLSEAAKIIRHHHVRWETGEGRKFNGEDVSILRHILHLADRIAVSIDRSKDSIGQIKGVQEKIKSRKTAVFGPERVDAVFDISGQE